MSVSGSNPLEQFPGLTPPPGQVSNFDHPSSLDSGSYGFAVLMILITTTSTASRAYTKIVLIRQHDWADYLAYFGWFMFIVYSSMTFVVGRHGAGKHQWDVRLIELPGFAYWSWITEIIYIFALCAIKVSICLQFLQIFAPPGNPLRSWYVWGLILSQTANYFAAFWVSLFQCSPPAKIWDPFLDGFCMNYGAAILAGGIINTVFDVLMLVFPLTCIWKLQAPSKRKMAIAGVFLVGILAFISSLVRTIISGRLLRNDADLTFIIAQIGLCTTAELAAGILAGNFISLPRFWKAISDKFESFRTYLVSAISKSRSDSRSGTSRILHSETSMREIPNAHEKFPPKTRLTTRTVNELGPYMHYDSYHSRIPVQVTDKVLPYTPVSFFADSDIDVEIGATLTDGRFALALPALNSYAHDLIRVESEVSPITDAGMAMRPSAQTSRSEKFIRFIPTPVLNSDLRRKLSSKYSRTGFSDQYY